MSTPQAPTGPREERWTCTTLLLEMRAMYTMIMLYNGEWVASGTVMYLGAFGRYDPVAIAQNLSSSRARTTQLRLRAKSHRREKT
jgi:hypothetical protein